MQRRYHLPTDITVSGDASSVDQERLTAVVSAAINLALAALPGEIVQRPAVHSLPRARVESAGPSVIPSQGATKQVGTPVATKSATGTPATNSPSTSTPATGSPAAGTPQQSDDTPFPAPMPTADVPYPPGRPDTALTGADSPDFVTYLRNSMNRGPDLATQTPVLLVDRSVDFWGFEDVRRYAEVLARGWQARLAGQKAVNVADTMRSLAKDFDETMQGSFNRSPTFNVPLDRLNERTTSLLAAERIRLERAVARRHLTEKDLTDAVLEGLLAYRARLQGRIEAHVVQSAWGWMRERREHLDFETLKSAGVRSLYPYEPTLPPGVVETDVVHAELVHRNRELTQQERDKALDQATKALRRSKHDLTLVLTDEQAAAAIIAAEAQKLGRKAAVDAVAAAAIAAEQGDLVNVHEVKDGVPVWGSSWDPSSTKVLRRTAEFVLILSGIYGKPFTASNYDHHGSLGFVDRGRSLDLNLGHKEESGFFPPAEAIRFALAIDSAARQLGVEWRVLYDDASVDRAVNDYLGVARMSETANVRRGKNDEVLDINWHGPLVTHFHLDLAY